MNKKKIRRDVLFQISRHYRNLGIKYFLKGLPYERCAELPYIIEYLKDRFNEHLYYLDIGTGESPLPTFFLKHTQWDISCVDKFSWVRRQSYFASQIMKNADVTKRFHIIEKDFLDADLPDASCDIITNVSVIEHFDKDLDIAAMKASGKLLKKGGIYILTTLINEGFYREFYVEKEVYGEKFNDKPVFYQRHYDLNKLQGRIIKASGLIEKSRVYFGDYSFQCFEKVFQKTPQIAKLFFLWATPFFARRFLSYNDQPVSRKDMQMNTSSGVILILTKA